VLYGPVLHKTQSLKLNLLLASLTAQAEGYFCSPEERLALLFSLSLSLSLSRSGAAIRWPFACNAGVEQASTYQWSTRGKSLQNHYRNASFTAITILKSVKPKSERWKVCEGSFGCHIRHRFFPSRHERMQFAGVWLLSCSWGVEKHAGSSPPPPILKTPSCTRRMLFLHAAASQGAKCAKVPRTPV
jgi:hypothetical protein